MRLWKLARMRMTRRFILLHNLEIFAFERALLGVGIKCCLSHWKSWWLEHELARTISIIWRSESKPAEHHQWHCIALRCLCQHDSFRQTQPNSSSHDANPDHEILHWSNFSIYPLQIRIHSFCSVAGMYPEARQICHWMILAYLYQLSPEIWVHFAYGHTNASHHAYFLCYISNVMWHKLFVDPIDTEWLCTRVLVNKKVEDRNLVAIRIDNMIFY